MCLSSSFTWFGNPLTTRKNIHTKLKEEKYLSSFGFVSLTSPTIINVLLCKDNRKLNSMNMHITIWTFQIRVCKKGNLTKGLSLANGCHAQFNICKARVNTVVLTTVTAPKTLYSHNKSCNVQKLYTMNKQGPAIKCCHIYISDLNMPQIT